VEIFALMTRININEKKNRLAKLILKQRVQSKDFTIISSNCWGSKVYQELDLPYNTPFIGLFFYAPCYIKLLQNLDYYLNSTLSFTNLSSYSCANEGRERTKDYYPIGLLGDGVEIHFVHYANELEAKEKWCTRKARMNKDKSRLFIAFTDRDLCEEDLLKKYDNLTYIHKVCFTAKKYPNNKSSIWIKEFRHAPYVGDLYTNAYLFKRHFDVANWLNGGSGKIGIFLKLINRLLEVKSLD
jgi:uncharacterized protein (DUF1919 family)